MRIVVAPLVWAACSALLAACGSDATQSSGVRGEGQPDAALTSGSDANALRGGGGRDGRVGTEESSLPTHASDAAAGGGDETLCDGIDNDGNGIVDDVDMNADGVCDCLALAVLGDPGWHQSTVFQGWLQRRANNGGVMLTRDQLTASELGKFQVLILLKLTGLPAFTQDELSVIEAWVRNGGGMMVLSGFDFMPLDNANAVLQPFGMQFSTELVLFNLLTTNPVSDWVKPHPVTDGISSIGYNNGNPVMGAGTVLARGADRDLMRALEIDQGRVLVWGDEWITFDSEWSAHPEYQVERLWLNSLKWLTSPKSCQVPIVLL